MAHRHCLAAAFALLPLAVQTLPRQDAPPEAPNGYAPVTDARLRAPAPADWLMYRRTYDGWGYSPLDQITARNVADLAPAWIFPTGVRDGTPQAAPIVNGNTMFVTTAEQVIALEADSGVLLWRYERPLPPDLVRPHPTNRGVALYDDKVYVGTLDAHVVALQATTGRSSGTGPSRTTASPTTSPWRRWWRTARSWWEPPVASTAFGAR